MELRKHLTPFRVLGIAFFVVIATLMSVQPRRHVAPPPAPVELQSDPEPINLDPPKTDYATVTGPKIVYVVPSGTSRITARIKSPSGTTLREFVITNWVTIKPGQHLELTTNHATSG